MYVWQRAKIHVLTGTRNRMEWNVKCNQSEVIVSDVSAKRTNHKQMGGNYTMNPLTKGHRKSSYSSLYRVFLINNDTNKKYIPHINSFLKCGYNFLMKSYPKFTNSSFKSNVSILTSLTLGKNFLFAIISNVFQKIFQFE